MQCLPDSLGRLNLLEWLEISDSGVKSLPKSVRQLNNLQSLMIYDCPTSQLNLRAGSFTSSLCNLKQINLLGTEVFKISIPQDCCLGLETIFIDRNKNLAERNFTKDSEEHKIVGLALEELTAETRWEEAGIESLERMEILRIVKLTAISRSAVEGCIQSMKKWPDKIIIFTRAAPDAVSLLKGTLLSTYA
ncbi:hypothetical protein SUGI_0669430 [Cryptomeria japonica]|nr:hypothetical protein SUGI_0669430 [Cryptomeria japonica]